MKLLSSISWTSVFISGSPYSSYMKRDHCFQILEANKKSQRRRTLWCMSFCLGSVVGRIIFPWGVYILISRTCEYATLCGKRNFADVIKLRFWRWGEYSGLPGWAQYNHKGPYQWKAKDQSEEGDMITKAGVTIQERFGDATLPTWR